MIQKRKNFFKPTLLRKGAFLKMFLLFLICCKATSGYTQHEEKMTTIILFRHAEKLDEANNADPGLSEKGKERAQNYADMFKEETIGSVYATPYKRTKQTLESLAADQNLIIKEYPPLDENAFASIFKEHEGEIIVICGHSNTVPALLRYFAPLESPINLDEDEYDKVFIISKAPSGKTSVLKLTVNRE